MNFRLGKISLIIKIYILVLSIFFIFRAILFIQESHRLSFTSEIISNILYAFFMGVRFDLVVIGYVMLLPTLILLVMEVFNFNNKNILKFLYYWILSLFIIEFTISTADIPYFAQFFARFSIGAFEWIDSPIFVIKMIIEEPKYYWSIIPFIVLIFVFFKLLKKIFQQEYRPLQINIISKIILSILILLLSLLSIRGRIAQKSPIRIGTAYFCTDPFLNQLGLNPTFTFINSLIYYTSSKNKDIKLIDTKQAIKNVRNYLNVNKNDSLIARTIIPDTISPNKPNIVLIIMESMSYAKLKRGGNTLNLTPFLDSISYQSYFFENIYTAGEHTYNGVFGTLFSMPAIFRQHPMKIIKEYDGIAETLKQLGYSTTYFTTHDGQFDNIEGFLRANYFDNVISEKNYPSNEIKTTLGVPDDYMFRYSIPYINKLNASGKPFFVSFMTASDHGPYYIPDYFKPHSENIQQQIIEYADWSLKRFISLAKNTNWFNNTIFVFIADHGAAIDVKYPISLNYHHSPLIFYAPKLLQPKLFSNIGGQIDVYPTIMGIIKQKYTNNTLGIDLINESRPYIMINADDKIAALDNEFLFILTIKGKKSLYKYKTGVNKNIINKYPQKAKEMEKYLRSNIELAQYIHKIN